jgi:Cu(I)/Ag(I) efflux system membrane fusion protein
MTRIARLALGLAVGLAACDGSRKQTREGHTTTTSASAMPAGGHEGHDAAAAEPTTPAGYAPVTIDPSRAAAIGLTTTTVDERDLVRQLRTTGIVVVDETRTAHVHPKVRGWVDGVSVSFVGQQVKPGQVLCGIYSQEVYAAEVEYLSLIGRTRAEIPAGELADQERRARAELVASARRRLAVWDVPKTEIERLEATREARRTFPLLSPRGGTVVEKRVLDGTYVDPSTELYVVSDLSRVWLLADVYEADVAAIHVAQTARLEVQGVSEPFDAKVSFVPPTIDAATRTLKVRFELANDRQKLRPGAFATVRMNLALGRGLAVPESSVIRTGARAIVFVVHGGAHVMPREVTLGPLVGDVYRVDAGLSAGDVVATGAQFLLDSETRLRATSGTEGGHGGHGGH